MPIYDMVDTYSPSEQRAITGRLPLAKHATFPNIGHAQREIAVTMP